MEDSQPTEIPVAGNLLRTYQSWLSPDIEFDNPRDPLRNVKNSKNTVRDLLGWNYGQHNLLVNNTGHFAELNSRHNRGVNKNTEHENCPTCSVPQCIHGDHKFPVLYSICPGCSCRVCYPCAYMCSEQRYHSFEHNWTALCRDCSRGITALGVSAGLKNLVPATLGPATCPFAQTWHTEPERNGVQRED